MGSLNSTGSNLSNLRQTLQAESPELSTLLFTSKMQSALENASPGDLVQLSDQALRLQQVGLLFGSTDGTQSSGFPAPPDSLFAALSPDSSATQTDPLLQALDSSLGVSGPGGNPSTATLSDQIANSANTFQSQELNSLFGTPQTVDPFFNTLG
jgi:hypothetical protein